MDLSIIPEIVGESIDGASRAAAAIGMAFQKPLVKKALDRQAAKGGAAAAVYKKRDDFNAGSLADKASDVADLATMIPVIGYGGALAKGALTTRRIAKASKVVKAEELARKTRLKQALEPGKETIKRSKAAKKAFFKKGGNHDQRWAEVTARHGGNRYSYGIQDLEYAYGPAHGYEDAIKTARTINKKIKKGASVANKHRTPTKAEKQLKDLRQKRGQQARPSRSAIAGAVYQMSKKKTKR